jgi:myo-inositol 2-dehydrogenase/D-chiro-inositol 1-dehydrogenase
MGALHAQNAAANSRLDLAWVADAKLPAAEELASRFGASSCSPEALIADPAVRGIIIASSSDALLGLTLAAAKAGKTVFVEKPLSLSVEQLQTARRTIGPGAPPVFVAFNRRFDPSFKSLRDRLLAGEIGEIETLHLINHDPQAPSLAFVPRSGGLFRDFTVHDFDTARWILGEEIVELFAWASCLIDPGIGELGDVDTAKLFLKTGSGRLCMISNSRRSGYGYDQRIEAFGSKGSLRVDNPAQSAVTRWDGGGVMGDRFFGQFQTRYADAYRLEMDHFADLLAGDTGPATSLDSAIAALRLADAAEESVKTGAPVNLSAGEASS